MRLWSHRTIEGHAGIEDGEECQVQIMYSALSEFLILSSSFDMSIYQDGL